MASTNDPTQPFLEATETYQARLFHLWKSVLKKVRAKIQPLVSFGATLIAKSQEIVGKVGSAVIKQITNAYRAVTDILDVVPNLVKSALRLGKRIIALIRKAADPNRIIAPLKKLFARYVKMLREIFAYVKSFVKNLDVLGPALSVLNSFKTVLRLIVSWIADVTKARDAVNRVRTILRKIIKTMKLEIKQAMRLRKDVMRLKPTA